MSWVLEDGLSLPIEADDFEFLRIPRQIRDYQSDFKDMWTEWWEKMEKCEIITEDNGKNAKFAMSFPRYDARLEEIWNTLNSLDSDGNKIYVFDLAVHLKDATDYAKIHELCPDEVVEYYPNGKKYMFTMSTSPGLNDEIHRQFALFQHANNGEPRSMGG